MIKIVPINPYPRQLFLIKDEPIEEVRKRFREIDGGEFTDLSKGDYKIITYSKIADNNSDKLGILMYFRTKEPLDKDLVHEATHVVLDVFNSIGEDINYDCQEPVAYLVEYIFNELQLFVKEDKK